MSQYDERRKELFQYFKKCVIDNFSFLSAMTATVSENSMGCIISYTSNELEICVYYERISYEIYSTMSINKMIRCYIDEIIQNEERKFKYATNEKEIESAVIELKTLILRHGKPFFEGITDVYYNVVQKREDTKEYTKLELIEEEAKKAWQKGEYEKVVSIYFPVKQSLNPIQNKRFIIARKKAQQL